MIEQIIDTFELKEKFSIIFRSTNPFLDAGQVAFPIKAVIYPTYGYYLTKYQFDALKYANESIGSTEFYISQVEYKPSDPFIRGEHWKCINPSFEEYYDISIGMENAIYSTNGSWGLLISHEDHALLVSNIEFWEVFKNQYPNWAKDYLSFLNYWRDLEIGEKWLENFCSKLTVKPC